MGKVALWMPNVIADIMSAARVKSNTAKSALDQRLEPGNPAVGIAACKPI